MNTPQSNIRFIKEDKRFLSGRRLFFLRKLSQAGFLLLLLLIPLLGIFRIDVSSGFIVFNRQVWFSDFALVFGFWLLAASSLVLLYSAVGTGFCGWLCPQNTFSTIANFLTFKSLGKRAAIDWEKDSGKVADKKNTFFSWLALGLKLLFVALLGAFIPFVYFYPPDAILSFVTFQEDDRITVSLYWIYFVFVLILFVNIAVVRHFACRYMCIYRMWQYLFKTKDTLHIDYDKSRSSDCDKCNYCQTQCMVDIDPTNISEFDSCTNCGACISACDSIHAKKEQTGLLKFQFGLRRAELDDKRINTRFKQRLAWVLPVWMFALVLFVFGIVDYDPYHVSVFRAESTSATQINRYQIHVASKHFDDATVTVSLEGLLSDKYQLSIKEFVLLGAERRMIELVLSESLDLGLHGFIVRVKTDDGWQDSYRVNHFVSNRG